MKSNYKPLGNYIKQIKKKNTDGSVSVLKGIRINKEFMESVANIQGTDLSKYRVVEKHQFAYNPMHVGRDEILPISVLLEEEPIIVSPAYVVFEILDHSELDPEYLMMWCRRSEFDRNVWFTTDSSVRGGFSWESLCELELPIPSIEKQNEIVKEYNTIVNRIRLNEILNQKLEDTAQALYKHWFVDFEFPNAEGKPYKSSGGEMVYNEELDMEIPLGWEQVLLEDVIEIFDSQRVPLSGSERINMEKIFPYYGAASLMDYVDNYLFDGIYILLGEDGTVVNSNGNPVLQYVRGKFWVNNHAHILKAKNGFSENSLYTLLANINITDIITGGVQAKINQTNLKTIKIVYPNIKTLDLYNSKISPIFNYKMNLNDSNLHLDKLKNILLSKMSKTA